MGAKNPERHRATRIILAVETTDVYDQRVIERGHGEPLGEYAERVRAAIIDTHKRFESP